MSERESRKFVKEIKKQNAKADSRLADIETSEYSKIKIFTTPPDVLLTGAFGIGVTYTSPDQRAFTSPNARGIFATVYGWQAAYNIIVHFGSSSDSPVTGYQQYRYVINGGVTTGNIVLTQFVMIPLGADGKFKMVNDAGSGGAASMTLLYIGWWE